MIPVKMVGDFARIHRHGLIALATLVVALGAAVWARHRLATRPVERAAKLKEVMLIPPGRVLRQLDLGYHSLAADLLFIRANLYYGEHILTDEQLPWLAQFLEILLDLDPDFKKVYLWGALATVYFKREIDAVPEELVHRANTILEKGMTRFPDDHRFPMRIAFNHYYELSDLEAALPYFARAAGIPGAPTWLRELLVDLYNKRGHDAVGRQVLNELIMETDDPILAPALRDRLLHYLEKEEREMALAARAELMHAWQSTFGYLPFDLFLLIREQ